MAVEQSGSSAITSANDRNTLQVMPLSLSKRAKSSTRRAANQNLGNAGASFEAIALKAEIEPKFLAQLFELGFKAGRGHEPIPLARRDGRDHDAPPSAHRKSWA